MMYRIQVTIDVPESRHDAVVEELEIAAHEHEGITIRTAGGLFQVEVVEVQEVDA